MGSGSSGRKEWLGRRCRLRDVAYLNSVIELVRIELLRMSPGDPGSKDGLRSEAARISGLVAESPCRPGLSGVSQSMTSLPASAQSLQLSSYLLTVSEPCVCDLKLANSHGPKTLRSSILSFPRQSFFL